MDALLKRNKYNKEEIWRGMDGGKKGRKRKREEKRERGTKREENGGRGELKSIITTPIQSSRTFKKIKTKFHT